VRDVLAQWNFLPAAEALDEILPCCGSRAWAKELVERRPLLDEGLLLTTSDEVWQGLAVADWLEAFRSHPRIGESGIGESGSTESSVPEIAIAQSAAWSAEEQRDVMDAGDYVKIALAEGNREYERRFNRVFIVCATNKPPSEILQVLQQRLGNDEPTELREAGEQQRQITRVRLRKWLQG
jgi:2-oxo-4-hydroxy-4-carboxy-5-ureidoimidazoline decarboxylase